MSTNSTWFFVIMNIKDKMPMKKEFHYIRMLMISIAEYTNDNNNKNINLCNNDK